MPDLYSFIQAGIIVGAAIGIYWFGYYVGFNKGVSEGMRRILERQEGEW